MVIFSMFASQRLPKGTTRGWLSGKTVWDSPTVRSRLVFEP
jgi:hypothetical protein